MEKKPSTRLSHDQCFGVNTNVKRPSGRVAIHALVFLRNVRGVVVQDQLDGGVVGMRLIKHLEKSDELARAMAVLHAGVNLARRQVDPREQAERAVALAFMVARESRMASRHGWQVGRGVGNRMDSRLLVPRVKPEGRLPR